MLRYIRILYIIVFLLTFPKHGSFYVSLFRLECSEITLSIQWLGYEPYSIVLYVYNLFYFHELIAVVILSVLYVLYFAAAVALYRDTCGE